MNMLLHSAGLALGLALLAGSASAQTALPPVPDDLVIVTGADSKDRFSFYFRTKDEAATDLFRRIRAACSAYDAAGAMLLDEKKRVKPVRYLDQEKTHAACAEILYTKLDGDAGAIRSGQRDAGVRIRGLVPFWVVGFEYAANNNAADVKVFYRQAHGDGRRYARTIAELVDAVSVRTNSNGTAQSVLGPMNLSGAFKNETYPYYGVVWAELCEHAEGHPAKAYCGDFTRAHLRWSDVIDDADRKHAGAFDPSINASGYVSAE